MIHVPLDEHSICRARDPITGFPCEIVGAHERHEISVRTHEPPGIGRTRWLTCDKSMPHGRKCLRIRGHIGACDSS